MINIKLNEILSIVYDLKNLPVSKSSKIFSLELGWSVVLNWCGYMRDAIYQHFM